MTRRIDPVALIEYEIELERINGKTDATAKGDWHTQQMLAQLPMMARPQSKEVFLLGFGSGITGGFGSFLDLSSPF